MNFNLLDNVFVGQLVNTVGGPTVVSQVFDPTTLTYLNVYEWEVFNGARLVEPLPFGMFGEIKPMNMNKSKLSLRLAPGYPDAPIFQELCAEDRSLNAQLVSSIVCRKVVAINSAAETGSSIWDSQLEAIDSTHAMRVTRHDPVIFQQRGFTVTREITLPARFRALHGTREITEIVPGQAALPILQSGDELCSEQQQTVNTKQVTTRTKNAPQTSSLSGSAAYEEGVIANTIETLHNSQPAADASLYVISSEVIDYGNGQWGKATHTSSNWPLLKGTKVIDELNGVITYTEQFVNPTEGGEKNVEYTPINIHRTLKRTYTIPTALLDAYHDSYPVRVNINLPQVLKNVSVVWNVASENGSQSSDWNGFSVGKSYSLSGNLSSGSSSSVAAIPEILVEIEETWGNNLPATAHIVYMPLPVTEAAILGRFGAVRWPVFKPRSHMIVGLGQRIGCSVKVSVGASSSGSESNKSQDAGKTASSDKDVSLTNNVVHIPPTIHDTIQLGGELVKRIAAVASGDSGLAGSNFPSIRSTLQEFIFATGSVSPTVLPATSGQKSIPVSGQYLIDSHVEPYKWGYAKVYAEIINANVLA